MLKICNTISLILGMIVVFSPSSSALERFEIGTGLMAFDYAEYKDNNVFLDGETGLIPGIILKLKNTNKRSYSEWVGSVYYNKIKYDGQTQSGTPLVTLSDALVIDTHFKLGENFSSAYGREQSLYAGLGYRYWLRNIHSGYDINGNAVAGLLEEYYWYYAHIGYTMHFDAVENIQMGFDFRLTKMFAAKMDIDFLGFNSYDNTSVNLGNKIGARFAMPLEIEMTQSTLLLTPYYEIIDIGKSNNVRVYSDGVATNTVIYEPRSETRNVGIELTWVW